MPEWISQTALGAIVGSGLSVWWRKAVRWQVNLVTGFFIGWWGGDWLIVALQLMPSDEISRAIGSALGLVGFSLMEGVMLVNWGALLGKLVGKVFVRAGK